MKRPHRRQCRPHDHAAALKNLPPETKQRSFRLIDHARQLARHHADRGPGRRRIVALVARSARPPLRAPLGVAARDLLRQSLHILGGDTAGMPRELLDNVVLVHPLAGKVPDGGLEGFAALAVRCAVANEVVKIGDLSRRAVEVEWAGGVIGALRLRVIALLDCVDEVVDRRQGGTGAAFEAAMVM
jgi:hypothetical protein